MKKGRMKWLVILGVIILAAIAWKMFFGGEKTAQYIQETASTGSITTYYNFSGTLSVNHTATIASPSATTVSELYVAANTNVRKNDRLMRLEDGTIVKAEIAGEITNLPVTNGSVVRTGDTLAEIMDLSSMQAQFDVDEFDVSAIELGKTAQITLDGSGSEFEGKVSALNKRATQNQSEDLSYFTATIDLSGLTLPAEALPGMQVTVKILNKHAENAVLLSMDALSFNKRNEPYVLMQNGKDTVQVAVQTGINDGNYVEITSGLKSGDVVLYKPSSTNTFEELIKTRDSNISNRVNSYAQ